MRFSLVRVSGYSLFTRVFLPYIYIYKNNVDVDNDSKGREEKRRRWRRNVTASAPINPMDGFVSNTVIVIPHSVPFHPLSNYHDHGDDLVCPINMSQLNNNKHTHKSFCFFRKIDLIDQ